MFLDNLKSGQYGTGILFFLMANLTGCSLPGNLPVMGTVRAGTYTQPHGNFSCPLSDQALGLNGKPRITDAVRITKTEDIPLSQRVPNDWRRTRIVSDKTSASRLVKFEDQSGTIIEFTSGKRTHETDMVLNSGMSGGVSWRFARHEIPRSPGRMVMGLLLVPWHKETDVYMGVNAARAYQQGQGPDALLWIKSNIVIDETIHTITIKLPIPPLLTAGIHVRDLSTVRDDIASRPVLQKALFSHANKWLAQCHFSKEIK